MPPSANGAAMAVRPANKLPLFAGIAVGVVAIILLAVFVLPNLFGGGSLSAPNAKLGELASVSTTCAEQLKKLNEITIDGNTNFASSDKMVEAEKAASKMDLSDTSNIDFSAFKGASGSYSLAFYTWEEEGLLIKTGKYVSCTKSQLESGVKVAKAGCTQITTKGTLTSSDLESVANSLLDAEHYVIFMVKDAKNVEGAGEGYIQCKDGSYAKINAIKKDGVWGITTTLVREGTDKGTIQYLFKMNYDGYDELDKNAYSSIIKK